MGESPEGVFDLDSRTRVQDFDPAVREPYRDLFAPGGPFDCVVDQIAEDSSDHGGVGNGQALTFDDEPNGAEIGEGGEGRDDFLGRGREVDVRGPETLDAFF